LLECLVLLMDVPAFLNSDSPADVATNAVLTNAPVAAVV
jgi:hypothetical protein